LGNRTRCRRKGEISLCVSSAPFLFLLLALPGPAPSRGVLMPSAAHDAPGQPCSTSFSVAGLSLQQRAEHCSPSQLSQVWGREHLRGAGTENLLLSQVIKQVDAWGETVLGALECV